MRIQQRSMLPTTGYPAHHNDACSSAGQLGRNLCHKGAAVLPCRKWDANRAPRRFGDAAGLILCCRPACAQSIGDSVRCIRVFANSRMLGGARSLVISSRPAWRLAPCHRSSTTSRTHFYYWPRPALCPAMRSVQHSLASAPDVQHHGGPIQQLASRHHLHRGTGRRSAHARRPLPLPLLLPQGCEWPCKWLPLGWQLPAMVLISR